MKPICSERASNREVGKDRSTPRLLIVSQVYKPGFESGSQIFSELAEGLAARGIEVHVLTSAISYMTGKKLPLREIIDDVQVWRTPGLQLSRDSIIGRITLYGLFLFQSGLVLGFLPRPDVIMYVSTPPFSGWSARLASFFLKASTIFMIQDVYPDVPLTMGYFKNPFSKAMLVHMDHFINKIYDHIVVVGERMRDVVVNKGIQHDRITIIENWSVGKDIEPIERNNNQFLIKHELLNKFVVQYSGNMGMVHNMEPIIEASKILVSHNDICFLMIGDGSRKKEIEAAKKHYKLNNILLFPYQPLEELPNTLTAADLSLISLRYDMEGLVVPSKLYGILAAGVPIIFIGQDDGEVARVIGKGNCGVTVQTGEELAESILILKADQQRRMDMGKNARRLYELNYGRARSLNKYEKLIRELSDKRSSVH